MFSSAFASPRHGQRAGLSHLYRQVGVDTQAATADPHGLVTMLFNGFAEAIAEARGALATGSTQQKGNAIQRAVRILEEGLRAGLDLKAGGSLAQDLDDLYAYLGMRLTVANLRNDDDALAEVLRLIQPLADAWKAIAPQVRR
ncbi:MAG: flagellar export chaperone FliS [Rubrivivax sp.]|jgi:flagellar protein FliS|nr:flagellar export chaperone FliS [Rubrivivax sp.]